MSRRAQFSRFGGPEVLTVVDVQPPHPGQGEVRVKVAAAGINPFDTKIFRGLPTSNPHVVDLPSGNGSDFAGAIDELGADVTELSLGDAVFGSRAFQAQADFVVIRADRVSPIPTGLTIEQAGALDTVGRTAWASVASLGLHSGDVVLVTAAAGGVGSVAAQLAHRNGATVIGSASAENHDFLRSINVIPVEYGDGMIAAVHAIAPDGITAALDNHGNGSVEAALELGAPAARINSIADYAAPQKYGIGAAGASAASIDDIRQLAQLIADGEIILPIDSLYPLERVTEAYERLLAGHLRGKIVLLT